MIKLPIIFYAKFTGSTSSVSLILDDILFVRGTLENFLRMKEVEKVTMLTDEKLTQEELENEDNILVEIIVTDKAQFVGKSLMKSDFSRRFGLFILAIRREGTILRKKIAHVALNAYDTLHTRTHVIFSKKIVHTLSIIYTLAYNYKILLST